MVFFGAIALILCCFLLGHLWRPLSPLPLGTAVWGYLVKSLLLSWIWFLLSYYTPIGAFAPWLVLALLAAVALHQWRSTAIEIQKTSFATDTYHITAGIFAFSLLAVPGLMSLGSTFVHWDAVVSWNRWAIELSNNLYAPAPSAYPVLWPAIWSLIYEAQSNRDIWYFAQASMVIPAVLGGLFLAGKCLTRQQPMAHLVLAFLVMTIFFFQSQFAFTGYMDVHACLIGIIGVLLLAEASTQEQPKLRMEYLLLAGISLGLAMLTKQTAAVFGLIFGLYTLVEFARRRISFTQGVILACVLILPTLTFWGIYLEKQPSLFGNLSELTRHTENARGADEVASHALNVLTDAVPGYILPLLCLGTLLNIFWPLRPQSLIGITCALAAIPYFYAYAECCSYNVRNGLLVYALLTVSCFTGFQNLEKFSSEFFQRHPAPANFTHFLNKTSLGWAVLIMAALVFFAIPQKKFVDTHDSLLEESLGHKKVAWFLEPHKQTIQRTDKVISYFQPLAFMPYITPERYEICKVTTIKCLNDVFAEPATRHVVVFTAGWNESQSVRDFWTQQIKIGRAELLRQLHPNSFRLFRVTRDNWEKTAADSKAS